MKKKWMPFTLFFLFVLASCGGSGGGGGGGGGGAPAADTSKEGAKSDTSQHTGGYEVGLVEGLPALVAKGGGDTLSPFEVDRSGYITYQEDKIPSNYRVAFQKYCGEMASLAIAETYQGTAVHGINSLPSLPNILTLSLPKGVDSLGFGLFNDSRKLATLYYDCANYAGRFWESFTYTPIQHFVFGKNVRVIPDRLFENIGWDLQQEGVPYKGIETVEFDPDCQVESIGEWVFPFVHSGDIEIPSSVRSIGGGAFYTEFIETIFVSKDVETIGENAFSDSTVVFTDATERKSGWAENFSAGPVAYGKTTYDFMSESMGLGFIVEDGEARLIRCDMRHEYVEVPAEIEVDGTLYPVTTIGKRAFDFPGYQEEADARGVCLKQIHFSEGITTFEEEALDAISANYDMKGGIDIYLPSTAVNFGHRAIYGLAFYIFTPHDEAFMEPIREAYGVYGGIYYESYSLPFEEGGYMYFLEEEGAKLCQIKSKEAETYYLPETVFYKGEEYPVTSIREYLSFEGTTVYLPANLLRLQRVGAKLFVFREGSKLCVIDANSGTCIKGEENLAEIQSITGYGIHGEEGDTDLDLRNSKKLRTISKDAFRDHTYDDIYLPSFLEEIGVNAFRSNTNNPIVHFASLEVIPDSIFDSFPYGGPKIVIDGEGAQVKQDGMTFVFEDGVAILVDYVGDAETLVIPDEIALGEESYPVTAIRSNSYYSQWDVEKDRYVLFPDSGPDNDTVKKLVLGENVATIGERFFRNFYALNDVEFKNPSNLSSVGKNAFPASLGIFVGSAQEAAEITYRPRKMYLVSGTLRADTVPDSIAYDVTSLFLLPGCTVSGGALTRFTCLEELYLSVGKGYQASLFNGIFAKEQYSGSKPVTQHLTATSGQLYENTVTTYAPSTLTKISAYVAIMSAGFFNYVDAFDELSIYQEEEMGTVVNIYRPNAFRAIEAKKLSLDGHSVRDDIFASDVSSAFYDAKIAELELRNDILNFPLSSFANAGLEKIHLDKPEGYEEPVYICTVATVSGYVMRAIHIDFDGEDCSERIAAAFKAGTIKVDFFSGPIEMATVREECEAQGVTIVEYDI